MKRTPIPHHLVAAFLVVARAKSYSKAGKELGVSKGTVSRAIVKLEEFVGAELIHRNSHSVALSTAGAALYEKIVDPVAAIEEALGNMPERSDEPSGELRITAPHDVGLILLPPLVEEFSRQYPRVWFDIKLTSTPLDLVSGRFDLAIRAGQGALQDSSLVARKLGLGSCAFYASPSYLLRRGSPAAFGDPKHDWVLMSGLSKLLDVPKNFRAKVLVDDTVALQGYVRQGVGIGPLPNFVAAEAVAEGSLVRVLPKEPRLEALQLFVIHLSRRHLPRKVAAFRDYLLQASQRRAAAITSSDG